MIANRPLNKLNPLLLALLFAAQTQAAVTDISTDPLSTYTATSTNDVKPNVLFVLDDSGSMNDDFLPDWAASGRKEDYLFHNATYNGVAYNPAVKYVPPVLYNADGTLNTTTYPSMNGTSASTGGNSSATSGSRNWKAVPNDAFGIQFTGTSDLEGNAFYYTVIPGEYCTAPSMRTCTTATTPSASYPVPAMIRWCDSTALSNCRSNYDSTFKRLRMPYPRSSTLTVSGSSSNVTHITVNGQEILSATAAANSTSTTFAQNIVDQINLCSSSIPAGSQCTVAGFYAIRSGSKVIISAPNAIAAYTPVITQSTSSITVTAFVAGYVFNATSTVPGENFRTNIISSVNSYAYPGTAAKAPKRTDCAGTTCTYAEEMTNYANWWAYYHTRMQMMKTAASNAFSTLDTATDITNNVSRFRVGFMTISDGYSSSDFLNLGEFKLSQKNSWYTKLFNADPASFTPLRAALATAGQLYAGKLTSIHGISVTDPLQYSCQQNYTILSTDGYWNTDEETSSYGPYKLDNSTSVGNQDAALARPLNDGGTAQNQSSTSTLQSQSITAQPQQKTNQLQSQSISYQQQARTSQLQSAPITYQPQAQTSQLQSQTAQLQKQISQLQATTRHLQSRTKANSGAAWTGWADTNSCTYHGSGTYPYTQCQYNATTVITGVPACSVGTMTSSTANGTVYNGPTVTTACNTVVTSAWANAASCTATTTPDSSGNTTQCRTLTGSWTNASSCTQSSTQNCQYTAWGSWANVASCTPVPQSTAPNYTVGTARQCQSLPVLGSWTNASSCTLSSTQSCQYTTWGSWANVPSCSAVAQSTGPNYTVAVATQCQTTGTLVYGPWTNASSCTVVTNVQNCRYAGWSTSWSNVSSCTPLSPSTGPNYTVGTASQCQTVNVTGSWVPASSCTSSPGVQNCQYTAWSAWSNVSSCTPVAQSTGPNYTVATATQCQNLTSGGTSDTLADVAAYYYGTDLRSPNTADGTGTCTGPIISPATTPNNLCDNNVPAFGRDVSPAQHMTTFTLGLGAQGEMVYTPDYWNDTSGDFYDVKAGTTANPGSGICSWQTSGACNWPTPASDSLTNIDDLWHAAINGRGTYYTATDPSSLANGLSSTLNTIINTPKPGTAAAAASSNPNVSSSDNYVFSSSYKSVDWYGELIRQQINVSTGALSALQWSAMTLLDCATTSWSANTAYVAGATFTDSGSGICYQVATAYTSGATFGSTDTGNSNRIVDTGGNNITPLSSRLIYFNSGGLTQFLWSNLNSTQQGYFTQPAITYVDSTHGLSQFCTTGTCLTTAQQTNTTAAAGGAAGENLVNFLRGDRTHETDFYRQRTHVLGDIVSSEGRYVKQPLFSYSDAGYSAYVSLKAARQGEVYVAANDGMLHAFNADTGQESWAFIPSMVLPNLYKLADKAYPTKHQYYVDGTPEVGDMCPNATSLPTSTCTASQWKTILVGGLNRGGQGYYALDITDPANPTVLWEISNTTSGFTDLGYTYGNPKITKLKDGRWVVIFTSGYNNADGVGQLYVVNALTGALIRMISTSATGASATSPSGLSRIAAFAPQSQTDNTTVAVYGGDLFGNLWRFDINGDLGAAGYDAQLLVTLKDASGNVQPITAKPTVTTISTSTNPTGNPVVFIGTGRFLGVSDIADTSQQSFYAIKDKLTSTSYGNPHAAGSLFVDQTLVSGACPTGAPTTVCKPSQAVRTIASNSVDWDTDNGWYIDFLSSGERSTTDSSLGLGTLVFTTIAPQSSTANACGTATTGCSGSYSYALNYLTGGAVDGALNVAAVSLGCGIATRPVLIRLADGTIVELIRTSGGGGVLTPEGGGTSAGGSDLGNTSVSNPPVNPPSFGSTRRTSWRTLQ